MANDFKITISAIDKTTATVRKVNNQIGKAFRPFSNLVNSTKMLGREMGIGRLGAKISSVGKNAAQAAGHLSSVAAPLTAIVGGGSIAGIAALATEWGRLGAETARTAQTLGVSTGYLQSMRGAAAAAGLSSDAMTGSLKSLGDTMQDATYGRNQMALSMLSQLGIRIRHTKDGAIDTSHAFNDMSRAIKGIKSPQVQGLVARTFGLEAVLPLLRQGPDAIAAYQKKVESLGGVMNSSSIAAAEKFSLSLNYLKIATEGVRNSIGDRLMPILNPLVDKFTDWLGKNRELIATRIAEFVQGFATWLEKVNFNNVLDGITEFIRDVSKVVEWIGGWKVAMAGVAVIMAGPMLLSVVQMGAGIARLGMTMVGMIPGVISLTAAIAPYALGLAAIGIAALAAYEGMTKLLQAMGTLNEQGDLAQDSWLAKMNDWLVDKPDNSSVQLHMSPKAIAYQQQQAAAAATAAPPAQTVSDAARQQAAANAAAPQSVSVDVHFKNAPPGTAASARDGGGAHMPVRVAHSMAGA